MKKSIRQAVSRGVALLVLLPAAHTAFAGVAGSVEYRVAWDNADSRYHVYMRPTTAPNPDLSMTGQVTLRVPHATGTSKFTVTDIKPKAGTTWSLSSEVFGPSEDKAIDYLSFSFMPIDVRAFAFKAGVEQEAFSFKNTGPCMGSVALMNNNTDPFNQPPDAPNNSAGTNPGNQFANAGWGATDDNDYSGNYGGAAECGSTTTINTVPVANKDTAESSAGKAVTIDVLKNDSDADGDTLVIASFTQGSKGSITQSGNSLIYTPKADATGTDTFTYTIADPDGAKSTGTVSVTLTTVTPPPELVAQTDNFDVQATASGMTLDVLANDTIPAGQSVTLTVVGAPKHGTATVVNNKIVFIPTAGYTGTDTLTYRITDAAGNQTEASINLTINVETTVDTCTQPPATPEANKAYYRIGWSGTDQRYHVYMYASSVPSPNSLTSAQVTLKAPIGKDAAAFTPTDVQSAFTGLSWSNNSSVHAPTEDAAASYLSFTPAISNAKAMLWQASKEIEVFSFANKGACLGSVSLIDNATDAFNQPADAPNNSVGTNPGNSLVNLGWGSMDTDNYAGNYGCPATCSTDTTPKDTDADGLTDAEEATLGTNPKSTDSDGDGVLDKDEIGASLSKPLDTDSDGKIDALDTDDDGDGLLTGKENYTGTPQTTDTDKDGIADFRDKDDDNDGIPTASEKADANTDGTPDDAADTNNNGKPDYLETPTTPTVKSVSVPTLTQWAQLLLSMLLGAVALRKYVRLGK